VLPLPSISRAEGFVREYARLLLLIFKRGRIAKTNHKTRERRAKIVGGGKSDTRMALAFGKFGHANDKVQEFLDA